MTNKAQNKYQSLLWLLILIGAFVFVTVGLTGARILGPLTPIWGVIVLTLFAFLHGTARYGIKKMVIFFCITSVISWSYETLSILTGFPFGYYHYTSILGIKIGLVPLSIMPSYFSVCYLTWTMCHILLDQRRPNFQGASLYTIPFFASFLMVMWDLSFDPIAATIANLWIWEEGGAYFGVPVANFLGWFLCTYTIFQAFAFYLKSCGDNIEKGSLSPTQWLMPPIMYAVMSLQYLLGVFNPLRIQITTLDKHTWWTGDIFLATTLVCLFTMVFVALLSIVKILNTWKE